MDPQRILAPAETVDALARTAFVHTGDRLVGAYRTDDFAGAVRVLDAVAPVADELDHHPDVQLGWGRVVFELSSHDVGGVTSRDLELARRIDVLAGAAGAQRAD
ncbi:pterin-4-alpha-carbinolamine dehydratase [Agromyces sp. CF514]|uniref:4a-hydroxytetrahydrobiopterin dehydratase n=1 Tax=Agromyces sp. CF514 TaxID=1881031 RepID=UPI0008E14156|nr:4a-hydroxytetrahydrobiopterin dehydratase [Agromyces sp. CF514]SFR88367.1 pterin-4-alpha-carbinolamine dehydratase [Agromyces sp. CF514]